MQLFSCVPVTQQGEMNKRKQTGSTDLLVDHLTNKQQKVHRRSYGRGQKLQALKKIKIFICLEKRGAESTTGFPEG